MPRFWMPASRFSRFHGAQRDKPKESGIGYNDGLPSVSLIFSRGFGGLHPARLRGEPYFRETDFLYTDWQQPH
jgi:hypothetical protein